MDNDWREPHYNVIVNFLEYLNGNTNKYVLKGGTALMLCYDLNRFSEDIDLDGFSYDIIDIINDFSIKFGYECRVAKDTDTVKRCLVHYGGRKPLKIEVSYRVKRIDFNNSTTYINGILVYTIQNLLSMKLSAYAGRDKIRDLFDVVFIGLNYWEYINEHLRFTFQNTLSYKGLEQFDYVIRDQSDELIDNDLLANNFLELWDKLELM